MELTDTSLLVLLGMLALGLFVLVVVGWPRRGGRVARGATRGAQVVVLNLLVVALCGAALNDQYLFYSSWDDLLGARSSSVSLHHGGSSSDVVHATVRGPGFTGIASPTVLPRLPQPSAALQTYTVVDRRAGVDGQVLVHLPVGYDPRSPHEYPVILGLHGFPSSPQRFMRLNFISTIDQLTAEHKMAPTIVVAPRIDTPSTLDTECVNYAAGQPQTDTWLAHDLPLWVAHHFRVQPRRTSWAAVGYSYGAWCAASISLRHPDVFGAAVVLLGYFRPDFTSTYDPLSSRTLGRYDLVNIARTAPPALAMWVLTSRQDPLSYPSTSKFSASPSPLSTSRPSCSSRVATATRCSSPTCRRGSGGSPRPCRGSMADPGHAGPRWRRTVAGLAILALVVIGVIGWRWAFGSNDPRPPASSAVAASTHRSTETPNPPDTTGTTSGQDAGPRTDDPLTLVGLGDSVPEASTCGCTGYVGLLGQALHAATRRPVVVHNDASGGATTSDVEQDLRGGQTAADLVHADVVTVEVGANDFDLDRVDDPTCLPANASCWAGTLTGVSTGLTDIVAGIRDIDTNPHLQIALVGYWNVTVDGDVGAARGSDFVAGSDALTRDVNDTIKAVARSSHAIYVDAYTPFKGAGSLDPTSALLDDGDHLNAEGHAIMESAVFDALQRAGVVAALTSAP